MIRYKQSSEGRLTEKSALTGKLTEKSALFSTSRAKP